jgi:hypothetical protein
LAEATANPLMNLLNFFESVITRTSQFTIRVWLLTFACVVLAIYAVGLSRRQ